MTRALRVLLAEDNPGDVLLTRDSIEASGLPVELHVVEDGKQAIDFLRRRRPYQRQERPDFVLLDLNLPKLDGRQVMAAMHQHDDLRHIPVVVLTASDVAKDIHKTQQLGATCYVTKPVTHQEFVTIAQTVELFRADTP